MPRRSAFDDWRILAHLRTLAQDLSLDGESSASAVHCEPGGHYHNLGCCSGAGHHTNFLSAFLPAAESCDFKSLLPRRPRSSPPPCATTSTAAEDRSYRLHSRCPSSAAAPASSPTSASGFSALAGSPGYDCTLLARYFRYAYVCPLTTLVFSCSPTSAAAPSFSMGYARHHHLRFTSSSAVWFSLSSSFSFFPSSQHGGK